MSLLTLPIATPADLNRVGSVAVSIVAIAAGIFAWVAPWGRWHRLATLTLVPVAFALIALGNVYGGSNSYNYGVFFVVAFVWIGLVHRPWTSSIMAPLAAVAYILPLLYLPGNVPEGVGSAALTIPVCVLVGESLSWIGGRLHRTEEALDYERGLAEGLQTLDKMKNTFLSAVSHELRTPITICRGHLEVLNLSRDPEQVQRTLSLVVDELGRNGAPGRRHHHS